MGLRDWLDVDLLVRLTELYTQGGNKPGSGLRGPENRRDLLVLANCLDYAGPAHKALIHAKYSDLQEYSMPKQLADWLVCL
jgi:hypothetical protein